MPLPDLPTLDEISCGLGLADDWGDALFVPHARTFYFRSSGSLISGASDGDIVSTIDATPSVLEMGAGETIALSFDFTDDADDVDVIASSAVSLTDLDAGTAYSSGLSGGSTIIANVVTQIVSALTAGRQYRLAVAATMTPSGNTYGMGLLISVPY